jgi:putative nucleotidyltransferase with HDIG domain/PAS domain S-box-containing protein
MTEKSRSELELEKIDREIVLFKLLFQKLLENLDAIVMVTDSSGNIVFANLKYLDYFGFAVKDIIGEYWVDSIIPEDKKESINKIFDDILKKEVISQIETPVLGVGNLRKHMCWMVTPLDEKKEPLFLFVGQQGKSLFSPQIKVHASTPKRIKAAAKEIIKLIFEASRRAEPQTAQHASRVMFFAEALARTLKIKEEKIYDLKIAAMLHDLGKLAVDHKVLFKKGKLDSDEFNHIKSHLKWGADIARLIYFLKDVVPIMANHHENYDGRGYPHGVSGENLPIEARILSIADIYEALTADRPYRKAFSQEEAIAIMEYEKGHKLDPRITEIFLDMVRKNQLKEK